MRPTIAIYGIQDCSSDETINWSHTHNITVMEAGKIIHHLTLERKTRRKYDNQLWKYLYELLKEKKLFNRDADFVFVDNVLGRSFLSDNGKIRFEAPLTNTLANGLESGRLWLFDQWYPARALSHELAHVYSCIPFYGNFKENSLLVHFDGGASKCNFSAWHWKDGEINLLKADWELKPYSSIYNANALSFALMGAGPSNQHGVAGKLMGFASFAKEDEKVKSWLEENQYFQHYWGKNKTIIREINRFFNCALKTFDLHHPAVQSVAANLQFIWEDKLLEVLKDLKQQTGTEYLYYGGGSALNIKANRRIVAELGFTDVFVPPCAEDSGLTIGAAVALEIQKGNKIQLHTPYLNNWGIEDYKPEFLDLDLENAAAAIADGKVIGVCNGPAETGPRALGNRSLLCRADSKGLAQKVSMEHKQREWYRPVAPVILKRNLAGYTHQSYTNLARYMLTEFQVKEESSTSIEGAVHVDGTARFQVIAKEDNAWLYALLDLLDRKYAIQCLINTSFNAKGEPIVHTTEDALRSAIRMKLDGVVINGSFQSLP